MMKGPDPFADPEPLIRRVYAYVAYSIGPGAEADDLAKEAVERGLRYRETYDPAKGPPIVWLVKIAHRCIEDRQATETSKSTPLPQTKGGDAAVVAVRAAAAGLSSWYRDLVALRYGAELTAQEIGSLTGRSSNSIEYELDRLHVQLRRVLSAGVPTR